MQITLNTTGMQAGISVVTDKDARDHCVVVVKGTFETNPRGEMTLAQEQRPPVAADEHHGAPAATSIRYECDFAFEKPLTDVIVVGKAVSPSGQRVTQLHVGLEVQGRKKSLQILGERRWLRSLGRMFPSDPVPFIEMLLTFERAFGGQDESRGPGRASVEQRNLVGVGFHPHRDAAQIESTPLPNLERPGQTISSPRDRPYPNTSAAKDLKQGSTSVTIGGEPLALKGKSYYQSSPLGNEAATRNFGGSVLTHTITGKTYFQAHSMDVKVEGKNVCRHLDITTSNHASYPGSTPPMPNAEEMIQLALKRIDKKQCPCCGSDTCPAAFKGGEQALSFEDFYKLNEPHPSKKAKFKDQLSDRGKKRSARFTELLAKKASTCACMPGNRVFPEPPCDVFREHDSARTSKIDEAWNDARNTYKSDWEARTGRPLLTSAAALQKLREQAGGKFNSDAEAKAAQTKANKQTRINHLVPKEAGGCPTNPGNLQPQSELCSHCQGIDDEFTDDWQ